jgi:hypothetical protein
MNMRIWLGGLLVWLSVGAASAQEFETNPYK